MNWIILDWIKCDEVFYNKNKLLYNLELFLVYILTYMVDYTRKHLNALWLTETLAECTKHTMTGWPARKACLKQFFFLIKHLGNIWIQSPRLIGFSYPDEFADCAFLCLSSICEHVLFGLFTLPWTHTKFLFWLWQSKSHCLNGSIA